MRGRIILSDNDNDDDNHNEDYNDTTSQTYINENGFQPPLNTFNTSRVDYSTQTPTTVV